MRGGTVSKLMVKLSTYLNDNWHILVGYMIAVAVHMPSLLSKMISPSPSVKSPEVVNIVLLYSSAVVGHSNKHWGPSLCREPTLLSHHHKMVSRCTKLCVLAI